jgi:bla regulator protein BlaR1
MISMLANHLWQSTLFVAVAGLLALVLRNNGAHLRYWLWMAASLKFLIPFSLLVALGSQFQWRTASPETAAIGMPAPWPDYAATVVQPMERLTEATQVSMAAATLPAWNVQFIILIVWACGFIGVLCFWLSRWLRVRRMLRTAQPLSPVAGYGPIDFPVPVKCVAGSIEPGIVGIFSPVLFLPQGLTERLSRQQLQAILAHERCHLQRRDNLTAAIHMLAEAFFWFHPLVWWIGARLVEERERACDAAVLSAGNDPEIYAEGILDVCQYYVATPLDCVAGVSGADLKKRVRAIMQYRSENRLHLIKQALLLMVGVAVVVSPVIVGVLTPLRTDAQVRAQRPLQAFDNTWPAFATATIAISQVDNAINKALLTSPTGAFTTRNWSLRGLIGFAYDLQQDEIQSPTAQTSDIASSRYNILAQAPQPVATGTAGRDQLQLMVRRLLAEKFQLAFHWESTRVPVYALIVSERNGRFKEAKPGDPGPFLGRGANSINGNAVPMSLLIQYLAAQLHRPVVDQTGLVGLYNFNLKWGPEPNDHPPSGTSAPQDPSNALLIETLQKQLGLTLISQDGDVDRMVIDHIQQPVDLIPARVAVEIDPTIFDRYVGYYTLGPDRIMTISRDGDRYLSQLTGQPALQMFAQSEREFFTKVVDAQATFVIDTNGVATELVLHQNGKDFHLPRMDESVAKLEQAALAKRIHDQTAMPGSEAALRRYMEGLGRDQPTYDDMTKDVADAIRQQWPTAKDAFAKRGQLQSIAFKRVTPSGTDVYEVHFENSSVEWLIGLSKQGKIDRLNYRVLAR